MTAPTSDPLDQQDPVVGWLLDGDPAVRWQVLRDLVGAPEEQVRAERSLVATEGAGAALLAQQGPDGSWGGAAFGAGFTSTMHVLVLLRELGLDPDGAPARQAVERVRAGVVWPGWGPGGGDHPFFAGEGEPCINGQVAAAGAYLGQDVGPLVDRLLTEQLDDGGWNCAAQDGSRRSSFSTTICVLEALLAREQQVGGDAEVSAARHRGEEYLLDRHLYRRMSTGEPVLHDRKGGAPFTVPAFPTWWHHDVLRGLEHLRRAGRLADDRVLDATRVVASRRRPDGRWYVGHVHAGTLPVDLGETPGAPSRWTTLRALRVLHHVPGVGGPG